MALTLLSTGTSSEDTFQSFRMAVVTVQFDASYVVGGYPGLAQLAGMSKVIAAMQIGHVVPASTGLAAVSYDSMTDKLSVFTCGAAGVFLAECTAGLNILAETATMFCIGR